MMKNIIRRIIGRLSRSFYTKAEKRHSLVGQPKLWEMKRDFQIKFLISKGLKPENLFLEIGCGTLRGGIPVINYLNSEKYWGIESRANVLEEAEKEVVDSNMEGKKPTLILPRTMDTQSADLKFDFIWAFSVLIHMSNPILEENIKMISQHLSKDGVFYANVNIGDQEPDNWQGFPVMWRTEEYFEKLANENKLEVEDIGSLKSLGHDSGVVAQDEQRMLKFYFKEKS